MTGVSVETAIEAATLALAAVEDFSGVTRSYLGFLDAVCRGDTDIPPDARDAGRQRLVDFLQEQAWAHRVLRAHLERLVLTSYQPTVFH